MSNTLLPTVLIDPNVEVNIILRRLYYRPEGYYQNAEQLFEAAKKAGRKFSIDNVEKFLHKQMLWQKYSPKPKYIIGSLFLILHIRQIYSIYIMIQKDDISINTVCVYV